MTFVGIVLLCAAAHAADATLPEPLPKLFFYSSSGLPASIKVAEEMQKDLDDACTLEADMRGQHRMFNTLVLRINEACALEMPDISSVVQDVLAETGRIVDETTAMLVSAVEAGHSELLRNRFKRQAHAVTYIPRDQATDLLRRSLRLSDRAMGLLAQQRDTDWQDYLWTAQFFSGVFEDFCTIVEQAVPITYARCSRLRNDDIPDFFKHQGRRDIPTSALAENSTNALLILAARRGYSVHALKYKNVLVKSTKSPIYEKTDLFRQLALSSFPNEIDAVKKDKFAVRKAILPGVPVSKPTLAELCDPAIKMAGK